VDQGIHRQCGGLGYRSGFLSAGIPQVTLPGSTIIGLAGSYAVLQNVWHMRNLRLQTKTDNLLDADYE
jgi:hypothetical protein